jgi:hypothetical protein
VPADAWLAPRAKPIKTAHSPILRVQAEPRDCEARKISILTPHSFERYDAPAGKLPRSG